MMSSGVLVQEFFMLFITVATRLIIDNASFFKFAMFVINISKCTIRTIFVYMIL